MTKLKIRSLFLKAATTIFIINLLVSCQKKITVDDILSKSIKAHGGIELWQKIDTLSFTKKTILYNQEGLKRKKLSNINHFMKVFHYMGKYLHLELKSQVYQS